MKVKINQPFRSAKYQRVMKAGEIVNGTQDWAKAVEKEGLATIIDPVVTTSDVPMPRKRIKRINKKTVETASLQVKE